MTPTHSIKFISRSAIKYETKHLEWRRSDHSNNSVVPPLNRRIFRGNSIRDCCDICVYNPWMHAACMQAAFTTVMQAAYRRSTVVCSLHTVVCRLQTTVYSLHHGRKCSLHAACIHSYAACIRRYAACIRRYSACIRSNARSRSWNAGRSLSAFPILKSFGCHGL